MTKPLKIPVFLKSGKFVPQKPVRPRMDESTREMIKGFIKVAGYHNDSETLARYMHTPYFGFDAAMRAWKMGVNMRTYKVPCPCSDCKKRVGNE